MEEWIKDHKKLVIAGSIVAASGLIFLSWMAGRKYGANQMVNAIVDLYENGGNNMIVSPSNKKYGNLMYEISAECIGD